MDLVDKQQRSPPGFATRARCVEHLFEVADSGKNRRYLLKVQIGGLRQQARHRGLASAGRSPEDQRAEAASIEQASECTLRREQMVLAHDFAEPRGPQLVGERTRRVALEP